MKPILNLLLSCVILLSIAPATRTAGLPDAPNGTGTAASAPGTSPNTQDTLPNVFPPAIEFTVNEPIEPQGSSDRTLLLSSEPSITQFAVNNWQIECVDCPKKFYG